MSLIQPRTWPYNPQRYFGRVGEETMDNIRGVKKVFGTIPETIKFYKHLPKTYAEAQYNFIKEYEGKTRSYMEEDCKRKNAVVAILQLITYFFVLLLPFGKYLDTVVTVMNMHNSSILFAMDLSTPVLQQIHIKVCLWFALICYIIFCYKGFTARNKLTMNPIRFTVLLVKYRSLLIPGKFYETTMDAEYGKDWYLTVFKE